MKRASLLIGLLLGLTAGPVSAQSSRMGVVNQPAPSWGVSQWLNLPKGKTSLDPADYKGKVVYLYAFQSWCPGCHKHGFPSLKEIIKRYGNDPAVAIVAVQTAFEGFHANGFEQAKQTAARYDLKIPVGHSGTAQEPSLFMRRYRTGGTPWTIIIDGSGVVRSNDFHIEVSDAVRLINRLKGPSESKTD